MFILGLILAIVGFVIGLKILLIVGLILLVVGLLGNGYAHISTPVAGGRRRYWY